MSRTEPAAHVLDLDHLSAQTFGDRTLESELLRLFEAQCRSLLPAISDDGAGPSRTDAAHMLKGTARAVGANRIAALTQAVEDATAGGLDKAILARLVRQLTDAIDDAAAAIALRRQEPA